MILTTITGSANVDLVVFLENNWFAITALITFVSFCIKIMNKINAFKLDVKERDDGLNKKIDESLNGLRTEMNDKIDKVSEKVHSMDEKLKENDVQRIDNIERTRIIMAGVEATLITLHDNGYNGPVTSSLNEMKEYKAKKSAL